MIAKAHHGSVSKEQRALIEDDLKRGRLPCVVATSSLELGIDMGAVDLVVQIESPPSVASALQRVGRAGHQVGEVSRGVLFPKHRGDLAQTAVAVGRMRSGAIEALRVPANPLDVLAQQVVAATALDAWSADDLFALVRRSAPFTNLPRSAYDATLDLLSGRYPSDEFAELRPRIVWDRVTGTLTGRPGAQRLAVTSGGTIPDRGLFGVFLVGGEGPGRRVGELDEEMVYESRVGDIFALGATSWRIEDITHDRVLVTPAPGIPGRLPFWKGDSLGRPAELGAAIGAFTRELGALPRARAEAQARAEGLDEYAATNLVGYLHEQLDATNLLPSDQTLVVERFRDELGDWRLVVHSPYGIPVHAPWALAINARLRERYGVDGQAVASDDGIVVRIPDTDAEPPAGDVIVFEPDEIEAIVTDEVGGSALFASRFRECAARALLLPRRDPGRRSPLWQQRQRSAALLEVASKYPSFPIVLEAVRECLQDVYDLPSLVALMRGVERREVQVVDVVHAPSRRRSPAACSSATSRSSCTRATPPSPSAGPPRCRSTRGCSPSCSAGPSCASCSTPRCSPSSRPSSSALAPDRRARDAEGVADLLRLLGPLTTAEVRRAQHRRRHRVARQPGRQPTGRRGPDGRRGALGRDRGRRPAARRPRRPGPARHARRLRRAGRGPARRPGRAATPAPTARSPPTTSPPASASAPRSCGTPCSGSPRRAGCSTASSARRAAARSGATPRCCAGCAAGPWPGCARRSSRSSRRRWAGSWRRGSTSVARHRGIDGVLTVVDQLAGCAVPASALEPLVLAAPGPRLRAVVPRRADRLRRGDLGRPRRPARIGRLGLAAPGRPGRS